jgi:hypothetical protein
MFLNSYLNIKIKTVVLALFILSNLVYSYDNINNIYKSFDYLKYKIPDKEIIKLKLQNIAAIKENNVIIGGVYETDILPLHPVLFISKDRCKSWNEIKLNVEGSGISRLKTYSRFNVCFIIERQEESAFLPEYLLRCDESGNITFLPLREIQLHEGIQSISFLEFYDEKKGLCNVIGSSGKIGSFFTKNGGIRWEKLWEVDNYYEYNSEYPNGYMNKDSYFKSSYSNINNPNGYNSTIQYRETENTYIIEIYDYKNKKWEQISKIPIYYKFNLLLKIIE